MAARATAFGFDLGSKKLRIKSNAPVTMNGAGLQAGSRMKGDVFFTTVTTGAGGRGALCLAEALGASVVEGRTGTGAGGLVALARHSARPKTSNNKPIIRTVTRCMSPPEKMKLR